MNELSPHHYRSQGLAAGIPQAILESAQRQKQLNQQAGSRPILSLNHLAKLSGAALPYLREIVKRRADPYQDIRLEKRGGRGLRPISAPEPVLLEVQRVVLARALDGVPLHSSAYAYRKNRSVVECASQHTGAQWLIKLDLHNFFGSINERQVYAAFRRRLYSPLVSFELARLCTRLDSRVAKTGYDFARIQERYAAIPAYASAHLGVLPQGAPTSGVLANMSVSTMDKQISDRALENGLIYTRYSDDITLSTASQMSRAKAQAIVREVTTVVESNGHRIHNKKTRIVPPGARHVVLGLLLAEDTVRLLPEFRRRIEVHVRGVSRFGLVEHSDHRKFKSVLSFINHVEGCLAFAMDVDPEWSTAMRLRWDTALASRKFPPTIY